MCESCLAHRELPEELTSDEARILIAGFFESTVKVLQADLDKCQRQLREAVAEIERMQDAAR